jgi:hypothetical protein
MPIENKSDRASSSALAHLDGLLDEALEQTFPASDAVAIDIEFESHDREAQVLDSRHSARWQPEGGQRTAHKH